MVEKEDWEIREESAQEELCKEGGLAELQHNLNKVLTDYPEGTRGGDAQDQFDALISAIDNSGMRVMRCDNCNSLVMSDSKDIYSCHRCDEVD